MLAALDVLEPADPAVADAIYAGTFTFGGETVEALKASPFLVEPPSAAFARSLHGFSWLRHVAAVGTRISRSNARSLVAEWLSDLGRPPAEALEPAVTASRLTAWLAAAPALLQDADRRFRTLFFDGIGRDLARLTAFLRRPGTVPERLDAAIAIAAASHALDLPDSKARAARQGLARELGRQILPDGGHVSRSPLALLRALLALLPTLEVIEARGVRPADDDPALGEILEAADRMVPMLSFFRGPDGALVRFNGVGETRQALLAAVLDTGGPPAAPPLNARYSGFQRIEAGETVAVMETGPAPPRAFAEAAHAGCLSFELFDGPCPVVVNCGVPARADPAWRAAARTTAAHSTLVVDDTASARFQAGDGAIVEGPTSVPVERFERNDRLVVVAGHDGYRRRFGLVHRRALLVGIDGREVTGRDSLSGPGAEANPPFAVRFHLHPDVKTSVSPSGRAALITIGNGTIWRFAVDGAVTLSLEDSVHVMPDGLPRRTSQIVLAGRARDVDVVRWRFERQPVA